MSPEWLINVYWLWRHNQQWKTFEVYIEIFTHIILMLEHIEYFYSCRAPQGARNKHEMRSGLSWGQRPQ